VSAITLQSLSSHSYVFSNGTNLNSHYTDMVYANLKNLSWNFKDPFPTEFDDYKKKYQSIMIDDVCAGFFSTPAAGKYNFDTCKSDEFYTKGLNTMIVKINEDCRYITQYLSTASNKSTYSQKVLMTDGTMNSVELFTLRCEGSLEFLIEEFLKAHAKMASVFTLITCMVITAYIGILFLCYWVFWLPYTQELKVKIWRTNSMLNMIPISIVTKNEKLCQKIISDNIFESVL
jgi:hypothetical protein